MANETRISGLILAGGAGRRVQGRDKGLLVWHERPLIEHVADRFRPQVDHLMISCNRNIEVYARLADAIVRDNRTDFQGPLAGIEAATPLIECDYLIVVACDTPLLPTDLVQRLLDPLNSSDAMAPVISYANDGRRDQYLFAAIHTSCLHSLKHYLDSGGRAVRHWYHSQRSTVVPFPDQPGAFANYNSAGSYMP